MILFLSRELMQFRYITYNSKANSVLVIACIIVLSLCSRLSLIVDVVTEKYPLTFEMKKKIKRTIIFKI